MKHWVGTLTVVFSVFLFSNASHADGFVCTSNLAKLKITVENFRNAVDGTRNVEFMTIESLDDETNHVTFESKLGVLRNRATYYIAKVDMRYNEIKNSTLEIFKKPLTDHETLYLEVDFSYTKPVPEGTSVRAQFSAINRETRELSKLNLTCERTKT